MMTLYPNLNGGNNMKEDLIKLLQFNHQLDNIYLCSCGAITVENIETGESFSCHPVNAFSYFEANVAVTIQEYVKDATPDFVHCNHCANHWGLDLCECGSGEPVGRCECGSTKASQNF